MHFDSAGVKWLKTSSSHLNLSLPVYFLFHPISLPDFLSPVFKMNQSTSVSNQPQITRLSLAKFSHTTTTIDHTGPLLWNHVNNTNGDLACILELFMGSPSTPARLIIRVARNDGILVGSLCT